MKKLGFLLFAYFLLVFFSCPEDDFLDSELIVRPSYDFDIHAGKLYLANPSEFRTLSMDDPLMPTEVGTVPLENTIDEIFASSGFVLMKSDFSSFVLPLDLNGIPTGIEPTAFFLGCQPTAANDSLFFDIDNSLIDCLNRGTGIESTVFVIPKSNPLPPENRIRKIPVADPRDVANEGDLLFVADGLSGLKVFSIADLDDIQLLSHLSDFVATRVQVSENQLTVISESRLLVYDYSNPAALQLLAEMSF
ncbi:MAG: hypothetical protein HUU01_02060 [Saprospiraceae bacterium]|nr:hypothetical protein [Saprospiraceae bacterium]